MKKYSKYIYFLALLFFIYITRKYHIYTTTTPSAIQFVGFFLLYTMTTFCIINVFPKHNNLLIKVSTVLFILVFIRHTLSNIDLLGEVDFYGMILYPCITASILYSASAFGLMFLTKKYSKN